MGLDVSFDCFHGPYSRFHRFRKEVAAQWGIALDFMEGFFDYDEVLQRAVPEYCQVGLPFKWDSLKWSPIFTFLHHSDCDGIIKWEECIPIAFALEEAAGSMEDGPNGFVDDNRTRALQFAAGLRRAAAEQMDVEFS